MDLTQLLDEIRRLSREINHATDEVQRGTLIQQRNQCYTDLKKHVKPPVKHQPGLPKLQNELQSNISKLQGQKQNLQTIIDPREQGFTGKKLNDQSKFYQEIQKYKPEVADLEGVQDLAEKHGQFHQDYNGYVEKIDGQISAAQKNILHSDFAMSQHKKINDFATINQEVSSEYSKYSQRLDELEKTKTRLQSEQAFIQDNLTAKEKIQNIWKKVYKSKKSVAEVKSTVSEKPLSAADIVQNDISSKGNLTNLENATHCLEKAQALDDQTIYTEKTQEIKPVDVQEGLKRKWKNFSKTGEFSIETKADKLQGYDVRIADVEANIRKCREAIAYLEQSKVLFAEAQAQNDTLLAVTEASVAEAHSTIGIDDTDHTHEYDKIKKSRRAFRDAEDAFKKRAKEQLQIIDDIESRAENFDQPGVNEAIEKLKKQKQNLLHFLDDIERSWETDCRKQVKKYAGVLHQTQGIIDDASTELLEAAKPETAEVTQQSAKPEEVHEKTHKMIEPDKLRAEQRKAIKELPRGKVKVLDYSDPVDVTDSFEEIKKAYAAELEALRKEVQSLRQELDTRDSRALKEKLRGQLDPDGKHLNRPETEQLRQRLRQQYDPQRYEYEQSIQTPEESKGLETKDRLRKMRVKLDEMRHRLHQARKAVSNMTQDILFVPESKNEWRVGGNNELLEFSQKIGGEATEVKIKLSDGTTRTIKVIVGARNSEYSAWRRAYVEWYELQRGYNLLVDDYNELANKDKTYKAVGDGPDGFDDGEIKDAFLEQDNEKLKARQKHQAKFQRISTGNGLEDALLRLLHELEFDLEAHNYIATIDQSMNSIKQSPYQEANSHSKLEAIQKMQKVGEVLEIVQNQESKNLVLKDVEAVLDELIDGKQKEIFSLKKQSTASNAAEITAKIEACQQEMTKYGQIKQTVAEIKHEVGGYYERLEVVAAKNGATPPAKLENLKPTEVAKMAVKFSAKNALKGFIDFGPIRLLWKKLTINPFELFGLLKAWKFNPDSDLVKTVQQWATDKWGKHQQKNALKENLQKKFGSNGEHTKGKSSGDPHKNNSIAFDEGDLTGKKGKIVSRNNARATALTADPINALEYVLRDIANDFHDFIADQIEVEKRFARKLKKGAAKVVHGTAKVARNLPTYGKQVFASTLNVTKDGLVLTKNGAKFVLKKGVYFFAKAPGVLADGSMKFMAGYGFFLEGARVLVVFERTNGDLWKTGIHAGKVGLMMAVFSETPYLYGLNSTNFFVSSFSRLMLGFMRKAMPVFVAYGAYQLGTSQRFLHEDVTDWGAKHPEIMKHWYIPYASEGSAYVTTKVVDGLDKIFEPVSNKLIKLHLIDGYDPQKILPLNEQIDVWRTCAARYQIIEAHKEWFRGRILSAYKDPKIKKILNKGFEVIWDQILYTNTFGDTHLAYRGLNGEVNTHKAEYKKDKKAIRKGNVIYFSPFEIETSEGSETYFKLMMNGQTAQYDTYNNLVKNEYIVSEKQLDYISKLPEFDLVQIPEAELANTVILDQQNMIGYVQDKLHHFLYLAGVNQKLLQLNYHPKAGDKLADAKIFYKNIESLKIYPVKPYREGVLNQSVKGLRSLPPSKTQPENWTNESDIAETKAAISAQKADWLKHKHFTIVEFQKISDLIGEVALSVTSRFALAQNDPDFSHTVFLKKEVRRLSHPYQKRNKDGSIETAFKDFEVTEYQLVDNKNQIVCAGSAKQIRFYLSQHSYLTIGREVEDADRILDQKFSIIQPYYGIVRGAIDYQTLMRRTGDLSRLLLVNKIKAEGKTLFSLMHMASRKPIMVADSVKGLYDVLSSKKLQGKYVLAKAYEKTDRDDFKIENALLLRTMPQHGIIQRYQADSREASDLPIHTEVFTLKSTPTGYELRNQFGSVEFASASYKKIDDFFANYHKKAIIAYGSERKSFYSHGAEQLGKEFFNSKMGSQFSDKERSQLIFAAQNKMVWWMNNDQRDNSERKGIYFIRDFNTKRDFVTTNVQKVKALMGTRKLAMPLKTVRQKAIYDDLYGDESQFHWAGQKTAAEKYAPHSGELFGGGFRQFKRK